MTSILSHIHPMLSHFPIILIIIGFIAETLNKYKKKDIYLQKTGYYFQIIGAITIILAVLTGLLFTKEPIGKAHEIGELHEHLAYVALIVLIISAFYKFYINNKNINNKRNINISYCLYFISCVAVICTGFLGGILVYDYLVK